MKLSESLGLNERVRFMGQVHYMPELFAAIDVVVVPSWDEGFSLVTIEAMAAKRPVIASNIGGIAQIVSDNSTGLLFAPRDIRSLTEKLIWLLSDAPLRERLAIQAQKDVCTRFGREQIIDRIESLYTQVLDRPDAHTAR
jgi:glycosyltransferase involved in cell wall biosynthesis